MYIKINDRIIPDADWRVEGITGELRFETNEGIEAIADVYAPEQEVIIEEYNDDDTLKAQWYMRKLISVTYKQNEDTGNWEIQAMFEMSANPITEIEEIRTATEDTDDGVFELAGIINEITAVITSMSGTIVTQQDMLNRISGLYDALADRVARIENK